LRLLLAGSDRLAGMEFRTEDGHRRYDELLGVAGDLVVGLDFDGTLSPIVEDPQSAVIHPDAPDALRDLAGHVCGIAVVTGRPARQVVELGHLERLADELPPGARLLVLGQYGHERWDASTRDFTSPEPPAALRAFRDELPRILEAVDAGEALVEEKGLAVAVHTRRMPDPQDAFSRLKDALGDAAERHGLLLEPGRMVLEVRSPGMHKGLAIRAAVEELGGRAVLFVGDDLGDIEAFDAVRDMRDEDGMPALLVCSSSDEQEALAEQADLVVPGPDGVARLLHELASAVPLR
jgi:trehalose 6-phosphate phosphatase